MKNAPVLRTWKAGLPAVAYYTILFATGFLLLYYRRDPALIPYYTDEKTMQAFADFSFTKPVVLRVLAPLLANGVMLLSGFDARKAFWVTDFAATVMALVAFYWFLKAFIPERPVARSLTFLLPLIYPWEMLLPRTIPIYYPYDSWALFFMCAGLALLYRQRWWAYYPLFVLATLNRETSCLLTMALVAGFWTRWSFRKLASHVGAQFAIWLTIKLALNAVFVSRGGSNFGPQGLELVGFFTGAAGLLDLFYKITFFIGNFCFAWVFVAWYFKRLRDPFLRGTVLIFIPFFLFFGYGANLHEFREYGEMLPFLLGPLAYLIVVVIRDPSGNQPCARSQGGSA